MLGDRYGWVPLPCIIDKKEFDDIRKNLKNSDKQLLDEWYQLDKNQLSEDKDRGCYILKRREGAFVKYEEWYKVEEKIRQILQKALTILQLKIFLLYFPSSQTFLSPKIIY